jgi:peptide/nickel transport system substrate-binding protein
MTHQQPPTSRLWRTCGGIASFVTAAMVAFGMLVGTVHAQQRGGVLVEAFNQTTTSLDPQLSSQRTNAHYSLMFDTLLSYTPVEGASDVFEVGPALATSFEVVSDTVIEFTLRDDVTFHDGSRFDAAAAQWNLLRARDHESSAVGETLQSVIDVEIVDDWTIRLVLAGPAPLLPLQLTPANPVTVYFVSQEAVTEMGDDAFARAPVGSGPMRFVEWIPDDRLVLERFDGHWELGSDGEALPYLDGYVQRLITDQSVARNELRTGDVHVLYDPLTQDISLLESDPATAVHAIPLTFRGFPSFYFNPRADFDSPFTRDVRLRQAVQHAVNREAMALALGFGRAEAHYYWGWYPGVPGYDERLPRYEYDPERARALLAEAGYPDGIDLEVKVINRPSDVQPLEVMQAMLAEVGIRMSINLMDRVPWVEDGRGGNFEALAHGNTAQPSPLLRQETRSGSTFNWAGYESDVVDELWAEAESEYDADRREDIYRAIQRQMHEDAYHFIGYRFQSNMGHAANLRGLSTQYNFRYLWLE